MQLSASMTVTIHMNVKEDAAVTDILKRLPKMVTVTAHQHHYHEIFKSKDNSWN